MKIPFNENETLTRLWEEENDQRSWLDRKLGVRKSTITATEELAKLYVEPVVVTGDTTTFKPFKFDFILLIIGLTVLAGLVTYAFLHPENSNAVARIVVFLILFALMGLVTVNFDPTRNLVIVLSENGISINQLHYKWDEIYKAYIIRRRKGKATQHFLALALDTGLTDRYEITGLIIFYEVDTKLSAFIEHYKGINRQHTAS